MCVTAYSLLIKETKEGLGYWSHPIRELCEPWTGHRSPWEKQHPIRDIPVLLFLSSVRLSFWTGTSSLKYVFNPKNWQKTWGATLGKPMTSSVKLGRYSPHLTEGYRAQQGTSSMNSSSSYLISGIWLLDDNFSGRMDTAWPSILTDSTGRNRLRSMKKMIWHSFPLRSV